MSNRSIKYLLLGIIAFLAIRYIPTNALFDKEIIVIAIVVSIAYAVIDKLLPSYKL